MDEDLFGEPLELRLRRELGVDPEQTPGSLATPTLMTPVQECAHVRTTKLGSNDKKACCEVQGLWKGVGRKEAESRRKDASGTQHLLAVRMRKRITAAALGLLGSGLASRVDTRSPVPKALESQPDPQAQGWLDL